MLPLAADEDVDGRLIRGLRRRGTSDFCNSAGADAQAVQPTLTVGAMSDEVEDLLKADQAQKVACEEAERQRQERWPKVRRVVGLLNEFRRTLKDNYYMRERGDTGEADRARMRSDLATAFITLADGLRGEGENYRLEGLSAHGAKGALAQSLYQLGAQGDRSALLERLEQLGEATPELQSEIWRRVGELTEEILDTSEALFGVPLFGKHARAPQGANTAGDAFSGQPAPQTGSARSPIELEPAIADPSLITVASDVPDLGTADTIPTFWEWCNRLRHELQQFRVRLGEPEPASVATAEFRAIPEVVRQCQNHLLGFGAGKIPERFTFPSLPRDQTPTGPEHFPSEMEAFLAWASGYRAPGHGIMHLIGNVEDFLTWAMGWCEQQQAANEPHPDSTSQEPTGAPAAVPAPASEADSGPEAGDLPPYQQEEQPWWKQVPAPKGARSKDLASLACDIDVVIMTATEIELQAVLRLLDPFPRRRAILRGFAEQETYFMGRFGSCLAAVTKCRMGSLDSGSAALAVQHAQQVWHPRAVIMVGIAFGRDPRKQKIGDVLVASQVISYEPCRVGEQAVPRGPIVPSSPTLLNRFEIALGWRFFRPDGRPCECHVGPILSGEKLVDNPEFKDSLFEKYPQAIGGEMEGAGLCAAAIRGNVPWILLKGICDWADGKKHGRHQALAAAAAVSLLHQVLSQKDVLDGLQKR